LSNSNAYSGKNIEALFKNSIIDQKDVLDKIRKHFKIEGDLTDSVSYGNTNQKADVILAFGDQRIIEVNVKSYKNNPGYNQLTRMSLDKFFAAYEIKEQDLFRELFSKKAENKKTLLFPKEYQSKVKLLLEPKIKTLIKNAFCKTPGREILVIYDVKSSIMRIYPMKEVIDSINTDIYFTAKGNITICNILTIQRKGGNGVHIHGIKDKTDPKHPGNDLQIKLKMKNFVDSRQNILLSSYHI
jgi:hypothetical protein